MLTGTLSSVCFSTADRIYGFGCLARISEAWVSDLGPSSLGLLVAVSGEKQDTLITSAKTVTLLLIQGCQRPFQVPRAFTYLRRAPGTFHQRGLTSFKQTGFRGINSPEIYPELTTATMQSCFQLLSLQCSPEALRHENRTTNSHCLSSRRSMKQNLKSNRDPVSFLNSWTMILGSY